LDAIVDLKQRSITALERCTCEAKARRRRPVTKQILTCKWTDS